MVINEESIKAELEKHHWLSGNCSCGNDTHWSLAAHHAWVITEFLIANTVEQFSVSKSAVRRVTEWVVEDEPIV